MKERVDAYKRTHRTRIVSRSGRFVHTIEYPDEPGVFYVIQTGRTYSGPFSVDDPRFKSV